MAPGSNVSSQEAQECCHQGNEVHGGNEPDYHAWLVFLEGTAHMLDDGLLFAPVPSLWLREVFALAHIQKRHITRTEYLSQCTCSTIPVFCTLGVCHSAFHQTRYLEIPSVMPCDNGADHCRLSSILRHLFLCHLEVAWDRIRAAGITLRA